MSRVDPDITKEKEKPAKYYLANMASGKGGDIKRESVSLRSAISLLNKLPLRVPSLIIVRRGTGTVPSMRDES